MPQAEKGSLKDLGKRIKAKGLQKLKFYCQMCEKQCRDANGFKCHLTSESHLRQMQIFSANAAGIMDQYSREFCKLYVDTLRMRHTTNRTNANQVYQQVIHDKQHVHMNATVWATLTDFVQYLGRTGQCVVEDTERGWYVTYIERDPAQQARREALERRLLAEASAERDLAERLEWQRVEAAAALDRVGGTIHTAATNLERTDADGAATATVQLTIPALGTSQKPTRKRIASVFQDDENDETDHECNNPPLPTPLPPATTVPASLSNKRPRSESATPMAPGGERTDTMAATPAWLCPDILVRIVHKKLQGGKFFKRKAAVDRLVDPYTAEVTVLDSGPNTDDGGDVLRLDQDDLETVVPKSTGKKVRIVRGPHQGRRATLRELDARKYRAVLELSDGTLLKRMDYEDFSKIA